MIPVAEALEKVLALAAPVGTEPVALARAAGRVLAGPAIATRAQPPFDAAAMDGYAVKGAEVRVGAAFRVVGEAGAGHGWQGEIGPGEALRIFTGAPMPEGADHVVIQEDTARDGDRLVLTERLELGANVRKAGQDFTAGDRLVGPLRLRPAHLALLAAMNIPEVTVARRPVVALIATGDELVMPGEAPRPDQIVASNAFALKAMAEAEGAEARLLPIARDTEASLRQAFDLAEGADLIVTIGGASVGDHDIVGRVAADLGLERAFYKVAMRPGKPLMAGRLGQAAMLGLPGNPVSAIVCGHLFLLPVIRAMQGLPDPGPRPLAARLAAPVAANGPRAHYMRATLAADPEGGPPLIAPNDRQDSALLGVLSESTALLIRPPHAPAAPAGSPAQYLVL